MPQNAIPPILPSRLKILHIISGDLWAGAEVQAFTLISSLKDDCDLHVVLMNNGILANKLKQANISLEIIDEQQTSGIGIISKLIKVIKTIKPDVIHTHRQKENILTSVANLAVSIFPWRRTKSLRTTHGAPEHNPRGLKRIVVWLDNITGKYAQDAVIAVSKDLAHKLASKFPPRHICIIENGIDSHSLNKLTPAPDIRAQAEEYIHIGIVGRLEPVKRVDLFIQAASQLLHSQQKYKLKFHVIGDGKLKNELISQSQQLGLSEAIIFHGHRTDSTAAIAALDIIVMCSDHEGTPMTALETLALGKPLVAHNTGGLREVLADYPKLLVSKHTIDGYAETLLQLFENPITTRLNPIYTSEENASRTLKLYRKLITQTSDSFTPQN
ncbi:glycosyltransferase [Cellvibrio sp. UBA7661]|uniref:glycosyltransferase n=1 Tax=Cellvibrio sp. UBA7661 TaxID=1946311 RepID=UPI002F35BCFA